jgi:flagellar hook-associated protein 2
MSSGGSLSGISFGGLGSGIDTASIIERLVQIESAPLSRLSVRKQQLQQQQSVFGALRTKLQAMNSSAGALNSTTALLATKPSSSDSTIATGTVESGANVQGVYDLSITQLAQTEKISSSAQSSTTTALGLNAGTVVVNGKSITVDSADSLRSLAQKINDAKAGVTASLIDGGAGKSYLTITSQNSGADNAVRLRNGTSNAFSALGVVGATQVRDAQPAGARSFAYANSSDTLAKLGGFPQTTPFTVQVQGQDVTIDPNSDSLDSIAAKINTATGDSSVATVVTTSGAGGNKSRLQIKGNLTDFGDPSNTGFWNDLGITEQAKSNVIVAAKDAAYKLDGIDFTSSSNTVSGVIPGATFSLLKADPSGAKATLSFARDDEAIMKRVKDFVNAYNDVTGYIKEASQFNKDTFASGPLFGDSLSQQIDSQLSGLATQILPGATGAYTTLQSVGITLDKDGMMSIDESKFKTAMDSDSPGVSKLFRSFGSSDNSQLSYISSTANSIAGNYLVNITQVATKTNYTGEIAQTSGNASAERLRFSGSLFGSQTIDFTVQAGWTATQTMNAINADSRLKDYVAASLDSNGKLKIESKKFGSSGTFDVFSDIAAAANNSGIGVGQLGTKVAGVDVAGTINGEAATGTGQFLTGNTGNARTAGIQVMYSGTTTGSVGSLQFGKGFGALFTDLMATFTDGTNGAVTGRDKSLASQIESIDDDVTSLQATIARKRQDLSDKFTRMENAIQQIQSQGQRLAALRK